MFTSISLKLNSKNSFNRHIVVIIKM